MRRAMLCCLLVGLLAGWALAGGSYVTVDNYALNTPASVEHDLDGLAAYLGQGASTPEERARVVYRWVTDRISYDVESYLSHRIPDQSAEAVLSSRTSVCAGYANLYEALARRCGLEVVVVGGQVRRDPQDSISKDMGHAWNAVRLQGRWYLLDPTWGSGDVDTASRKFHKNFNPYYFLVPPEQLIYSHVPDESKWQLLARPLSMQEVEALPTVTNYYFRFQLRALEQRGRLVASSGVRIPVQAAPGVQIRAQVLQGERPLRDSRTLVQQQGDLWEVDALFPRPGTYVVRVFASDDPFANSLEGAMEYSVEARRGTTVRLAEQTGTFQERHVHLDYPRCFRVPSGKPCRFSLSVPQADEVQVVSGADWNPLQRVGKDTFVGSVTPQRGEIVVVARFRGQKRYWTLLSYQGY